MAGPGEGSVLEGELTCPVCLDLFREPHLLPCGHSFCLACVQRLRKRGERGRFRCPECRESLRCSGTFQKNYKLANIAEDYRRRGQPLREATPAVRCDYCPPGEQAAAVKTCLKCEVSMCAEHVKPHLERPAFREHPLTEPLGDVKERKCPEHDETFRYYCADDGVCVCTACTVEGRHAGHTVKTLKNTMKDLKESLEEQLQKADRKISRTERYLQERADAERESTRFVEEAEQQVGVLGSSCRSSWTGFSLLRECVRAHSGTGPEQQENLSRISQDRERLQEAHSGIETLLQENDPFRFLQEFHSAGKRFRRALKRPLFSPDCVCVDTEGLSESMEAKLEDFQTEVRLQVTQLIDSVCAESSAVPEDGEDGEDEEEEDEDESDAAEDSEHEEAEEEEEEEGDNRSESADDLYIPEEEEEDDEEDVSSD